jgi:Prp8 binding protein
VQVWDLRRDDLAFSVNSHKDIITSIQLSPDGNFLLSNAMVGFKPSPDDQRCNSCF